MSGAFRVSGYDNADPTHEPAAASLCRTQFIQILRFHAPVDVGHQVTHVIWPTGFAVDAPDLRL